MIGGIFIAAMLGNTRFFMEFDYYRGVKLTFILPLILTAFGYMRRFPILGHTLGDATDLSRLRKISFACPLRWERFFCVALSP